MKKAGYILATLLEVLLLAGAYVVYYFTKKKMGMARYVVYKNRKWEEAYSLPFLKNLSLVILIVLTLVVLAAAVVRWKKLNRFQIAMSAVMTILTIGSVLFTVKNSTDAMRAYYFLSPMIASAAVIQLLKTGVGLLTGGKRNEK